MKQNREGLCPNYISLPQELTNLYLICIILASIKQKFKLLICSNYYRPHSTQCTNNCSWFSYVLVLQQVPLYPSNQSRMILHLFSFFHVTLDLSMIKYTCQTKIKTSPCGCTLLQPLHLYILQWQT